MVTVRVPVVSVTVIVSESAVACRASTVAVSVSVMLSASVVDAATAAVSVRVIVSASVVALPRTSTAACMPSTADCEAHDDTVPLVSATRS